MPRELWGALVEDKTRNGNKFICNNMKKDKLEQVETRSPLEREKNTTIKVKNPLVTQTIEVMKQTEMLQSLIDTYSNKSGSSNYLLNPCQMIPEVDFPPENAADFVCDSRFVKPIWFVPPQNTPFALAVPEHYPQVNSEVCHDAIRKAACGQLRIAGFTDAADSALGLFADATEEFIRGLMQHISLVHANDPKLTLNRDVEVKTLEKAYYKMTSSSLTNVHNYFKHNILSRNRKEIAEFNGVLQEYDKLMKESQCMQKDDFQEGDFLHILEMPQSNEATTNGTTMPDIGTDSGTMLSMLDGQSHVTTHTGIFKDAFNTKTPELEKFAFN